MNFIIMNDTFNELLKDISNSLHSHWYVNGIGRYGDTFSNNKNMVNQFSLYHSKRGLILNIHALSINGKRSSYLNIIKCLWCYTTEFDAVTDDYLSPKEYNEYIIKLEDVLGITLEDYKL